MISYYDGQLTDIMPGNINQKPEVKALSYALQQACRLLYRYSRRLYIYSNLDEQPEEVIDLLASELRTQYYTSTLDLDTKRRLVKNTLIWYMRVGTPETVEEFVASVFGEGKVIEWFEYGGEPFYFKVILNAEKGKVPIQNLHEVIRMIGLYKRLSAHLDVIELRYYFHVCIRYKNAVLVHINFWPRYPLTMLKLSGDWKLDGSHRLSGYNTDKYVDYYPVRTAAHILAPVPVSWDEGASARTSAKLGTDYCMDVSARSAACIRVPERSYDNVQAAAYTSVQVAPSVSNGKVQIINKLSGDWKLDGGRKLNAGIYPL